MQKWEYHKFEARANTLISANNQGVGGQKMTDLEHLDAFGKDGWELVAVFQNANSGDVNFFMKRPKS